jgi:PAS domain S-box-containing protein
VAFYFAYRYGMAFSHTTSSPFWFPDSVLLCALLLVRPRWWWVFVLAALPIRLLAPVSAGLPFWFLLATFANDSAKGLIATAALRRFLGNPVRFDTMRDFALYCLFAVLLVPVASAFGGAATRSFLGHDFRPAWEQWFLGNALTHLVVTPVMFYWVLGAPWKAPSGFVRRRVEGALLAVGVSATVYIAFHTEAVGTGFAEPRFYAPVPFLFWAAIRFGMFGASGAGAVLACVSVAAALEGHGPFSGRSPADTALALQHFLVLRAAPLYLVAMLIEQRRDIENSLRESEARFRHMADDAPVMVWVTDPHASCSFLSQSWYAFTGQTPETGLGFGWLTAVHPDGRASAHDTFVAANARREPFRLEYRLRRHDDEDRWVIDSAAPRFSPQGEFLGYIGSVMDITERKRAEHRLQENAIALRASYDRIQDLAGKLITAQEAERSRIARELHDDVNQQLASVSIALSRVKRRLPEGGT